MLITNNNIDNSMYHNIKNVLFFETKYYIENTSAVKRLHKSELIWGRAKRSSVVHWYSTQEKKE